MSRQSIPALALLALALALGPLARPGSAVEPREAAPHAVEPAAGPHAEAEAESSENPMEAEPSLAIWTFVVFLVLLGILYKLAWKPLLHSMHQREEHMEHTLSEAERARNESERLLAEHRLQMDQAADQVRSMIEQARSEAEVAAQEIVQKAHAEAEASKQRAERDISVARDQALAEIWNRTADLAVSVAGKVLGREMGADDQRRLVEVALSELPDSPSAANGHSGGPA